jgi:hypothetical protein
VWGTIGIGDGVSTSMLPISISGLLDSGGITCIFDENDGGRGGS